MEPCDELRDLGLKLHTQPPLPVAALTQSTAGPTSGCCSLQPATDLKTRNERLLLENPPITTPSFKIMLSKSLISIKEDDEENLGQGLLTNDCLVLFLQVIFLKH